MRCGSVCEKIQHLNKTKLETRIHIVCLHTTETDGFQTWIHVGTGFRLNKSTMVITNQSWTVHAAKLYHGRIWVLWAVPLFFVKFNCVAALHYNQQQYQGTIRQCTFNVHCTMHASLQKDTITNVWALHQFESHSNAMGCALIAHRHCSGICSSCGGALHEIELCCILYHNL